MSPRQVRTGPAERRAAERHRAGMRFLIACGVVAVLAGAVYLLAFSPVLALRADHITIAGAGTLVDEAAIRTIAEAQAGVPLSKLDTNALGKEMVTVRGVRAVTLARAWPNGLNIQIEAREPLAQISQDDHFSLVDADGVEAGESPTQVADLPVLSIAPASADERTVKAVLTVLDAIPDTLRAQIASIGADSPSSVSFTLTDGPRVVWGEPGDTELKVKALEILRAQVGAHEYDLSAPLTPITR